MTSSNNKDANKDLLPRLGSSLYNLNHKDVMIKNKMLKKFKILNKYIIIPLYRLRILPLLGFGRIFLILTTQGRKTGKKRRTPLEYHRIEGIITIFSGRGEDAGWMKNIRVHPDSLLVRHGFHRFQPQVDFVTNEDQKLEIIKWYVVNHGKSAKMLFGWIPKVDDPKTVDFSKMLKMITIIRLHHKNENRVAKSNYIAKVKPNLCTGCALCAKKCPLKAIVIKKEKARVDTKKCDGCGICIIHCTTEAIKLHRSKR